jgi:anti-sigma factor ChrR (cupin superfamily)
MRINADFDRRVVLHGPDIPWQASLSAGVSRRPLDRIGGEVARATSFVRFDPGSRFPAHVHGGGEEFLVLEGVFQDETGDFPAGAYVRNPPRTEHTPASGPGCVIFVKLWQFDPEDATQVRVDINRIGAVEDARRPGVAVTPLFRDAVEDVRIERLAPGAVTRYLAEGGAELLVLEGSATESGDVLERYSWVRVPPGGAVDLAAGAAGTVVWVKTGHLVNVRTPA